VLALLLLLLLHFQMAFPEANGLLWVMAEASGRMWVEETFEGGIGRRSEI
jgi:hypothetical protein